MDQAMNPKRVVLCGSPLAGKKTLLEALARYMSAAIPTMDGGIDDGPQRVFWEARFPKGGAAKFEAFHGPGFMYERAVNAQLARPASVLIYVLRQGEPEYLDSWIGLEQSSFDSYLEAAKRAGCSYREVPWLYVKALKWQRDQDWMTELIPPELASSALTVDADKGIGIPELATAIDKLLVAAGAQQGPRH